MPKRTVSISISVSGFRIIIITLVFLALTVGIMTSLFINLPEGENSHLLVSKLTKDISFYLFAGEVALGLIALAVIGYFIAIKKGLIKIDDVNINKLLINK